MFPVYLLQETASNLKSLTIVNDNAKTHSLSKTRPCMSRRGVSEPNLSERRNLVVEEGATRRNSVGPVKKGSLSPWKDQSTSPSRWGDSNATRPQRRIQKSDKAPVMISRRQENLISMMGQNSGNDSRPRRPSRQVLKAPFDSKSDSEDSTDSDGAIDELLATL